MSSTYWYFVYTIPDGIGIWNSEREKQENREKNLPEQKTNRATTQTQLTYGVDIGT